MAMAKYIEQEWKHEYKNTINVTEQNGWEFQDTPNMLKNKINIPQQDNIYDCGVFGLMYADFLTQDKSLDFSISDIEAMRYRVLYSIVSGELTNAGFGTTEEGFKSCILSLYVRSKCSIISNVL